MAGHARGPTRPEPRHWRYGGQFAQAHAVCSNCGTVHHVERGIEFRCWPGCGQPLPVIPAVEDVPQAPTERPDCDRCHLPCHLEVSLAGWIWRCGTCGQKQAVL